MNNLTIQQEEEKELKEFKKKIREALANYMSSEGCGCCGDYDGHNKHKEVLAKLLRVSKFSDGSGYDFSKYKSK